MNNDFENDVIRRVAEGMERRVVSSAVQPLFGFPHYAEQDGTWVTSSDGDWTGGHWVAQLWLAARHSEDLLETARDWQRRLTPRIDSDTVFRAFLFHYAAVVGERLFGDVDSGELATAAAYQMSEEFQPCGILGLGSTAEEASRVGDCETSIDAVGSLVALFSAVAGRSDTGDSLLARAQQHAYWHLSNLVNTDGSVTQSASFDASTGEVLRRYTHKGSSDSSIWARAQAWGLLAAVQSAAAFSSERDFYLDKARRIADWWIDHTVESHIPPWDFNASASGERPCPIDTSAAAIVAASLLKYSAMERDSSAYRRVAEATVEELLEHIVVREGAGTTARLSLTDGCFNFPLGIATSNELVWGSYYLLESLHVIAGDLSPLLL